MKYLAFCCNVLVIATCGSTTPSGIDELATPRVQGAWEYTATQTSPSLRMSGTLTITQQDDKTLSGSIDYMETDAAGISRRRLEMFSGRIRGNQTVSIDAFTSDGARKHIGTLVNDSIGGTFERPGRDGTVLNGSFAARRQ
jgi:hypothetical protein